MNHIRDQKLLNSFGEHVRRLKKLHNLTQEQLANAYDIPLSQIGRIDREEVNITIITLQALPWSFEANLSGLLKLND